MAAAKISSRERILEAAEALAHEVGPGHMSLDAVAQRAGVSKGGLLYNFPSKAKLLEALVEHHLEQFEAAFAASPAARSGKANASAAAFLEIATIEIRKKAKPPAAGVLAAFVENPDLLKPARTVGRRLIDRIKADADDADLALVVYLALEGMRCLPLLDLDVLSEREREAALGAMARLIEPA